MYHILHLILLSAWRRFGLRWEPFGGQAALGDYYLAVMDAVYPLCTTCLFMMEGTGAAVFKANWGALGHGACGHVPGQQGQALCNANSTHWGLRVLGSTGAASQDNGICCFARLPSALQDPMSKLLVLLTGGCWSWVRLRGWAFPGLCYAKAPVDGAGRQVMASLQTRMSSTAWALATPRPSCLPSSASPTGIRHASCCISLVTLRLYHSAEAPPQFQTLEVTSWRTLQAHAVISKAQQTWAVLATAMLFMACSLPAGPAFVPNALLLLHVLSICASRGIQQPHVILPCP